MDMERNQQKVDKFKYQKQVEQIQNHSGILSANKQLLRRHNGWKKIICELEVKEFAKQYYQLLYTIDKYAKCHPECINYIEKEMRLKAD